MIYLVTNNDDFFPSEFYVRLNVSEALALLYKESLLALDTETTGLEVHQHKLQLVQIGNKNFQIVIDTNTVDIRLFAKLLQDPTKYFVLHNAKFDLQFLYKHKIVLQNIYDTFLAESLLFLGYPPGQKRLSLKACLKKYLNIDLDKEERKTITQCITQRSIVYSAKDVEYLIDLLEIQKVYLKHHDLLIAFRFENNFVRVLAYVEFCGIRLDPIKWKQKMDLDFMNLQLLENQLDEWVINYGNSKYLNLQLDLFDPLSKVKCKINWNSSDQVIPLFRELGYNLEILDKKTGTIKYSLDAKILSPQVNKSSIGPIYSEYKKITKNLSAFGQNYLDSIDPVSGKIHANYTQLMNTTRLSSGGNNEEYNNDNDNSINLQNVPANDITRHCFIPEEGDDLIDVDYTAQEDLVFTELSREPKLIEFYNDTKKRDGHSFVAKMCFPAILDDVPEDQVSVKFPKLRSEAKKAKFAINVPILLEKFYYICI